MRRRRQRHAEHENHERWLVSYADFITLLFAFFVVMFASSQTDRSKVKQISDSVRKALDHNAVTSAVASILGGTVDEKGIGNAQMRGPGGAKYLQDTTSPANSELLSSLRILSEDLKKEIEDGRVQLTLGPRGLVISFRQAALFPSGEDVIAPELYASIEKVARAIRRIPNPVRLEGHTDSIPIHNARFRSNWDLSTARSIALLTLMTERFEVPVDRLSVAGYADTAPIAANSDLEGRQKNRRVDVVILNEAGRKGEPQRAGG